MIWFGRFAKGGLLLFEKQEGNNNRRGLLFEEIGRED